MRERLPEHVCPSFLKVMTNIGGRIKETSRLKKHAFYAYRQSKLHETVEATCAPPKRQETVKHRHNAAENLSRADICSRATATLGSGNLREVVKLPEGEDRNEWIAVNIVDFFKQISLLYDTLAEFCTPEKCPLMTAGAKYEYYWADGTNVKKPIKCSAPQYIDYLMTWVQQQLDDENVFPSITDAPFPRNFLDVAKTIMKRLFRIYAHIYYQHFKDVEQLKEEAHLNTSFKHFILFVQEFSLIELKELQPLHELIQQLTLK